MLLPHHCILDVLVYESLLQKEPHPISKERGLPITQDLGLRDRCGNWVGCYVVSSGRRQMCTYASEGYVKILWWPKK